MRQEKVPDDLGSGVLARPVSYAQANQDMGPAMAFAGYRVADDDCAALAMCPLLAGGVLASIERGRILYAAVASGPLLEPERDGRLPAEIASIWN